MKKLTYFLAVVVLFGTMILSCSKKEEEAYIKVYDNLNSGDSIRTNQALLFQFEAVNIKRDIFVSVFEKDTIVYFYFESKSYDNDSFRYAVENIYFLTTEKSREEFKQTINFLERNATGVLYKKRTDSCYASLYHLREKW